MVKQYRTLVKAVQVQHGLTNRKEIKKFLDWRFIAFGKDTVTFEFRPGVEATCCAGDWIVRLWNDWSFDVLPENFSKHFEAIA